MNCIYCHQPCLLITKFSHNYACYNHKYFVTYYNYYENIWFTTNVMNNNYLICLYTIDDKYKISILNQNINRYIIDSNIIPYISPESANQFISNLILL